MTNNKKPRRGTTTDFDSLHGALTAAMAAELDRCRAASEAPSSQFLAQVRQFLSDNGVTSPAHDSRFDRLKGAMPDMDELEKSGPNVVPLSRPA
jgi:hypothetical protein